LEDRKRDELSLDEYKVFFQELADLGCLYVLFSGGDIFVRPDALDILRAASFHRFDITLITHGMAITEEVADELADMGVRAVAASVYHTDPDIHDEVTLRKGSFHKTMAGLRRLKERGLKVVMKTPVFDVNQGAEETMQAFADELDMELHLTPIIRGGNDGTDDLLSKNMDLGGKANVYSCVFSEWDSLATLPKFDPNQRTCLAAHASAYLSPGGDIQPCLDYEQSAGNIRELSFKQIWDESELLGGLREVRRKSFTGCNSCENNSFCTLCPALAHRETGKPTGSAPSKCRESTAIRWTYETHKAEQEAREYDLFRVLGHEREERV